MGKLTMDEASELRKEFQAELKEHKTEQKEVISALAQNIEKLTETVTDIRVYQSELNNVGVRQTAQDAEIKGLRKDIASLNEKISDTNGKLAVADSFVKSANKLMWGVAAAIIMIIVKVVMDVA